MICSLMRAPLRFDKSFNFVLLYLLPYPIDGGRDDYRTPPLMSLSAYLAKNYLTASTPTRDPSDLSTRPKKRRKKDEPSAPTSSGLIIADDEDDLLLSSHKSQKPEEEDPDRPTYDTTHRSAEFRKSKKNNWTILPTSTTTSTEPQSSNTNNQKDEDATANAILAAAASENANRTADLALDDAPAIVPVDDESVNPSAKVMMSSGIRAGLQTADDTRLLEEAEAEAAQRQREKKAHRDQRRRKHPSQTPGGDEQDEEEEGEQESETVYRDATGRRIDISLKRAEARAATLDAERQAKRERESAMGAVQLRERAARQEALEDAKLLPLARGADDEEMNDDLRGRVRWDDPMAGYIARKQATTTAGTTGRHESSGGDETDTKHKSKTKTYSGAAPPNRYGIAPGARWDGVDRGNGFEGRWFGARANRERVSRREFESWVDE